MSRISENKGWVGLDLGLPIQRCMRLPAVSERVSTLRGWTGHPQAGLSVSIAQAYMYGEGHRRRDVWLEVSSTVDDAG